MKITKIYECIINLSAIDMYQGIADRVLSILNDKYLYKCEKNTLIIKIIAIEKMSECRLNKSLLDGSGQVSVQFRAEAIVYNEGDILTGCKVLKIDKGNKIICEYEYAYVNIKGNRNLQSIRVGQLITIKVVTVSYLKGMNKITINGIPYSYSYIFTVYKTKMNIEYDEDSAIIKDKIKEIDEELKLQKEVDTKMFQIINQIYYPFIEPFKAEKKYTNLKLMDILSLKPEQDYVYLIRHPIIDKATPNIFMSTTIPSESNELFNPKVFDYKIIEENYTFVLLYFLNDYLNHIRAIREMANLFKKDEDFVAHKNIWDIYGKLKKNI